MKGVIFNIVEDVVTAHLGDTVWDQLLDDAGIDHGHTALGTYSDEEMDRLVAAAAVAFGQSPRDVTVWIGERAVPYFYVRHPHYFEKYRSVRVFLPDLDQVIHPEVRKLDRAARPPDFRCTRVDENHMTVIYSSHRPLCGLAEGLMRGLGEHFHDPLTVAHPVCVHSGGSQCRFDVAFVQQVQA